MSKPHSCKVCGVVFPPYNSLQVACSVKCAIKLQNQKKKKKLELLKEQAYGRKHLIEKLDEITSKIIIKRYGGKCVTCGSTENSVYNRPTNGHLITRGKYSLRWDVREDGNCHCQCLTDKSKLLMEDGSYRSIKDIKTGDKLSSFDESTFNKLPAEVIETHSFVPKTLYEITLNNGEKFYATADHKVVANGEWIEIQDMLHNPSAYDILEL